MSSTAQTTTQQSTTAEKLATTTTSTKNKKPSNIDFKTTKKSAKSAYTIAKPTAANFITPISVILTTTELSIPASVPKAVLNKCKRNPNHTLCTAGVSAYIAMNLVRKKLIKRCVKNPTTPNCLKWEKFLELRRKMTPLDFVPSKCIKKPRRSGCRKFDDLMGTNLLTKNKKSKKSKRRKKIGSKKNKKKKHSTRKSSRKSKRKKNTN